jgi:hypothetical protein
MGNYELKHNVCVNCLCDIERCRREAYGTLCLSFPWGWCPAWVIPMQVRLRWPGSLTQRLVVACRGL